MIVSRKFGRVFTSVRINPVATLLWGILLLPTGLLILLMVQQAPTLGAILFCIFGGIGLAALGAVSISVGLRQIGRAIRVYFS